MNYIADPSSGIGSFMAVLVPGDSLQIMPGTYTEVMDFNPPSGVMISAYPTNGAVLLRPSGGNRIFTLLGTDNIVIDGLILDAVNCQYDAIKLDYVGLDCANHITVSNCEIKNARGNGIYVGGEGTGSVGGFNQFLNLHIHHNARFNFDPWPHGVYCTSQNNFFFNCDVHDQNTGPSNSCGFHFYHYQGGGIDNNIVSRCRAYNHPFAGVLFSYGKGNRLENCILTNNAEGFTDFGGAENTKVFNSTFYKNGVGINLKPGTAGATIQNNISYDNPGGNFIDNSNFPAVTVHTNNIDDGRDPRFANVVDFYLLPDSPAINYGLNLSAYFKTDIYGNLRSLTSAWDSGAVAFNSTAPIPPDPTPIPPDPTPIPDPLPPPKIYLSVNGVPKLSGTIDQPLIIRINTKNKTVILAGRADPVGISGYTTLRFYVDGVQTAAVPINQTVSIQIATKRRQVTVTLKAE